MKTKVCNVCGHRLPITEEYFYTRKGSKDGFRNDCKLCLIKRTAKYIKEHPNRKIKKWNKERKKYNLESLENEIWKDIVGYEGLYWISNLGRVKSYEQKLWNGRVYYVKESRILKAASSPKGYKHVILVKNKIKKAGHIHRLVAQAFIPNPNNYPIVNHKDENPSNNKYNNLEWCTRKYNNNYGTHNKRMSETKSKIVYQYTLDNKPVRKWITAKEMIEHGYNRSNVTTCCRKGKEKYKGYKWSYTLLKESDVFC